MLLITRLIVLMCLIGIGNTARILGIFPLTAKSHFVFNHAIFETLHDAGHHVTMVTPFPPIQNKFENFTYIDSRFNDTVFDDGKYGVHVAEFSPGHLLNLQLDIYLKFCKDVMKLSTIQEVMNSTEKLYDLVFIEAWLGYECYLPIAEKLGVPVIGTVTVNTWKWAGRVIGLSHNPSVMQVEPGFSNIELNFMERAQSLYNSLVVDYYTHKMRGMIVDEFGQDHFSQVLKYEEKQKPLFFYNNHASLLPRLGVPNAIDIGGIQVKPAKPLPKNVQKFIEEAPHGVIFFSLGSILKSSSLMPHQKEAFMTAFESIPQRVIWKFEEDVENLPKNIMISDWLPQRDILEHKNVVAFISHGGLGGMYEAVMTGTPVVTIPIIFDQRMNAAILQHRGVGVTLNLKTVTKEKVLTALNTVINDTNYYHRMQELSRAFKDRPINAEQTVIYWTDYVLRFDGAPYLKAIGTDMPLFKYFMLDIFATVLAVVSLLTLAIYLSVRRIFNLVLRKYYEQSVSAKKRE